MRFGTQMHYFRVAKLGWIFFAMNVSNLPNYTLEHFSECF